MRFKTKIKSGEVFRSILCVPLLNIVILALFIFIFSVSFVIHPGLKFNLPVAVTGGIVAAEELELTIKADSAVYLNNNMVKPAELKRIFKEAAKRHMAILIKVDAAVPLSRVSGICDSARISGVEVVNIGAY